MRISAILAARPKAQSCMKMKDPLACTASAICDVRQYVRYAKRSLADTYTFPSRDLFFGRYPGRVGRATLDEGSNIRRLRDEQRAREGGALRVVLRAYVGMHTMLVGATTSERREHYAMAKTDASDANGLK